MDQPPKTPTSSNLTQIVTIVGGFLVMAGVSLDWFQAPGASYSGTQDWTGVSAMAMGVVAILGGLAALDTFVKDKNARKFGAMVATAAGILAIILVALGATRADEVVAGGSTFRGLWVSGVGGIFAGVGGWLATQAIPRSS